MSAAAVPALAGAFAFAMIGNSLGSMSITALGLPLAWAGVLIAGWSA